MGAAWHSPREFFTFPFFSIGPFQVSAYGRAYGKPEGYPFPGFIFWMFIFLFALKRFFVQFLRFDYRPVAGLLSWIHLGLLAALLISGVYLFKGR